MTDSTTGSTTTPAPNGKLSASAPQTLQEAYCRARGCNPEEFSRVLLRDTLYPVGRLLWSLGFTGGSWFDPDRELVSQCGSLRRLHEIKQEIRQYSGDPKNRGLRRGLLRVRVSGRRLLRLAEEVMGGEEPAGRG